MMERLAWLMGQASVLGNSFFNDACLAIYYLWDSGNDVAFRGKNVDSSMIVARILCIGGEFRNVLITPKAGSIPTHLLNPSW